MIKIIAQNVDELLLRYENRDQISSVNISRVGTDNGASIQDKSIDAIIKRLNKLETSSRRLVLVKAAGMSTNLILCVRIARN